MKYFGEQSQLTNFSFLLFLMFSLNFLFFFNLGCQITLNQKNYNQCVDELEEERRAMRVGKGFSYKAQSYEECRAPARYRLDSD